MKHVTVTLTRTEWSALCEAVRASQEAHEENMGEGRFDATLSRVQRKLGVPVGSD